MIQERWTKESTEENKPQREGELQKAERNESDTNDQIEMRREEKERQDKNEQVEEGTQVKLNKLE